MLGLVSPALALQWTKLEAGASAAFAVAATQAEVGSRAADFARGREGSLRFRKGCGERAKENFIELWLSRQLGRGLGRGHRVLRYSMICGQG